MTKTREIGDEHAFEKGDPRCSVCDGDGWECGGGPGCTIEDNLAGHEPDHETPCPNAQPCQECCAEEFDPSVAKGEINESIRRALAL